MRLLWEENKHYIIFFIFLIFLVLIYKSSYYQYFKDPNNIRSYILGFGKGAFLAYLIIHIIQVVLFFIPGEIVEIAGGYIFGVALGSLLSTIGIIIGSYISYTIGRYFGVGLLKNKISKKDIYFFKDNFGSTRIKLGVFIVYLIPGMPKDVLAYVAGIWKVNKKDFMVYSTLGRIPCIIISSFFGERLGIGDIRLLILISVTMVVLFLFGLIKGDNIIRKITMKKNI